MSLAFDYVAFDSAAFDAQLPLLAADLAKTLGALVSNANAAVLAKADQSATLGAVTFSAGATAIAGADFAFTFPAISVSGTGHVAGAAMDRTLAPASVTASGSSAAGASMAASLDALMLDAADGYVDAQGASFATLDPLGLSTDCAVLAIAQLTGRLDRLTTDTGMPARPLPAPDTHVLRRPYLDRTMRKSA